MLENPVLKIENPRNITDQTVQIKTPDEGLNAAKNQKVQNSKTKVQITINGDKVFGIWIAKSPNCVNLDNIKNTLVQHDGLFSSDLMG